MNYQFVGCQALHTQEQKCDWFEPSVPGSRHCKYAGVIRCDWNLIKTCSKQIKGGDDDTCQAKHNND